MFNTPALRTDFALPGPSQPSTQPYGIGAFVPPPVPEIRRASSFTVWTTQGAQMTLPIPSILDERVDQILDELCPQFQQFTFVSFIYTLDTNFVIILKDVIL